MPALMTTREAAQALRVSPQTIRVWINEGHLNQAATPGRTVRVYADEVHAMTRPAASADA